MSDRTDARMKAFVAELVADAPEPPPFPRTDVVVVGTRHSTRGNTMTDTKTSTTPKQTKSRGPLVAVATFAVIVVVGVAAFWINASSEDEPVSSEPVVETTVPETVIQITDASAIVGTTGDVVDGLATARPNEVEFGADGTYRVKEFGLTLDTGTYTADGDSVTFESGPSDDVLWASSSEMLQPPATSCEGVVGEYTATFDTENLLTLSIVWDDCPPRAVAANGLVLRLTE